MEKKSCIYHFSAKPDSRVCRKHIAEIIEYADRQGEYIQQIYLDSSLKQSEKTEYKKMMKEAGRFKRLYIRDLFHLNKWTLKALADVKYLQEKGVIVNTMNSGTVMIDTETSEYEAPKNVLFYHSKVSGSDERKYQTQLEIVELFCREKTKWKITDTLYDESEKASVDSQPKLWELGDISDRYDLVIVQSFSRLDLRTARFEKIIKMLNADIFSLQEGLIRIMRKE